MAIVFQYGSNTLTSRINSENRLKGKAQPIGIACTDSDYELDFPVYSKTNKCAAASITPNNSRKIWGVLYEVPDYLISRATSGEDKSLDEIEGEGTNYQRIKIQIRYPDNSLLENDVITYIALRRQNGITTSQEYAGYILNGLKEHNIPNEYIEYVKGRVLENNPDLKHFVESE